MINDIESYRQIKDQKCSAILSWFPQRSSTSMISTVIIHSERVQIICFIQDPLKKRSWHKRKNWRMDRNYPPLLSPMIASYRSSPTSSFSLMKQPLSWGLEAPNSPVLLEGYDDIAFLFKVLDQNNIWALYSYCVIEFVMQCLSYCIMIMLIIFCWISRSVIYFCYLLLTFQGSYVRWMALSVF